MSVKSSGKKKYICLPSKRKENIITEDDKKIILENFLNIISKAGHPQ